MWKKFHDEHKNVLEVEIRRGVYRTATIAIRDQRQEEAG